MMVIGILSAVRARVRAIHGAMDIDRFHFVRRVAWQESKRHKLTVGQLAGNSLVLAGLDLYTKMLALVEVACVHVTLGNIDDDAIGGHALTMDARPTGVKRKLNKCWAIT